MKRFFVIYIVVIHIVASPISIKITRKYGTSSETHPSSSNSNERKKMKEKKEGEKEKTKDKCKMHNLPCKFKGSRAMCRVGK